MGLDRLNYSPGHSDSAVSRLSQLIVGASGHRLEVPLDLVEELLRWVAASQKWLNSMFDQFGGVE